MSESYANGLREKSGCKGIETTHLDASLVEAFERIATAFPSRIALGSDVWEPTYRELNETANRLAYRLIACGVATGDRVAILMSHDSPMVAAVLGTLKAGQIVVALDPADPVARLKILVEDVEPSVIVTDNQNLKLALEFTQQGCQILIFESESVTGPVENLSIEIPLEQTAFLVYTSGTTGRPKGVMRTHRQLRWGAAAHTDALLITEHDRIPLFALLSTGQGLAVFACTLLNGAMLCPFSLKTRGITRLPQWIVDHGLTVYFSSASLFRTFIKTIEDRPVFSNVRAVLLATELITADDFNAFRKHFPPESIFIHTLASSEATVIAWSRWSPDDKVPEGVFPVGHFARDMDVLLLTDSGQPVPHGEIGEIVVKSRYMANGYWRDPELTAKRFSADLDGKGTRLLWTGDLGRINENGMIELRGRKDDRIKIRGYRIEVVEIERCLERLPGINRAAAVAVPRKNYEPVLVAFVIKTSDALWTPQRLRDAARASLPAHMVPSRIVFLDNLPYRGNKIDREALRQYTLPIHSKGKGGKPRTETEMLLADIWAEVLNVPEVSLDADFFNLGGDSLRGAVVATQIYADLGIELSLGAIADYPTISTLAAFIDECRLTPAVTVPPIVRVPRGASMPLSSIQEACTNSRSLASGTIIRSYRIIGPLHIEIFRRCLGDLIDRHEILRTNFDLAAGCAAQIIHSSAPLGFTFIDLIGVDDADDQANLVFREAASQAIDLARLPIMRHVLVRTANDCYRFARIGHQIIFDGFAWQILDAELAVLYEARLQGHEPPLPTQAPLQYADYAVWQRQVTRPDSPYFKEVTKWWKNLLSTAPPATRLPFRRLIYRANLDPSEGVLQWNLEERAAKRLDEIASSVGTTHFIIRLAAFAALIADVTGNSNIVIGTLFANRNRIETQNIVGRFLNSVALAFSYDPKKTFLEWLEVVHNRVFETLAHGELPFDEIQEQLRTVGIKPPDIEIYFMLSRDHLDQRFANIVISNDPPIILTMPFICTVYVDEKKPENCQLMFDARRYGRKEMRALLNRYIQVLETAARDPELPVGRLFMMIGAKPLRLMCATYATAFYRFLKPYYDSSPLMKMASRQVKRWFTK